MLGCGTGLRALLRGHNIAGVMLRAPAAPPPAVKLGAHCWHSRAPAPAAVASLRPRQPRHAASFTTRAAAASPSPASPSPSPLPDSEGDGDTDNPTARQSAVPAVGDELEVECNTIAFGGRPAVGDELEVECNTIAFGGRGVCILPGGFVIFCERAIPGEKLIVKITSLRKGGRFAHAEKVGVITPSPHSVEPPCPYFQECGGCTWQVVPGRYCSPRHSMPFNSSTKGCMR